MIYIELTVSDLHCTECDYSYGYHGGGRVSGDGRKRQRWRETEGRPRGLAHPLAAAQPLCQSATPSSSSSSVPRHNNVFLITNPFPSVDTQSTTAQAWSITANEWLSKILPNFACFSFFAFHGWFLCPTSTRRLNPINVAAQIWILVSYVAGSPGLLLLSRQIPRYERRETIARGSTNNDALFKTMKLAPIWARYGSK